MILHRISARYLQLWRRHAERLRGIFQFQRGVDGPQDATNVRDEVVQH